MKSYYCQFYCIGKGFHSELFGKVKQCWGVCRFFQLFLDRDGAYLSGRHLCASKKFSFGSIRIDGVTNEHDVVIDRGDVRKRKKKPSKKFRDEFGNTPVSIEEKIPWKCRRLIIGSGTGALPVMDVKSEAKGRKIALLVFPTPGAIEELKQHPDETNAILHVTC